MQTLRLAALFLCLTASVVSAQAEPNKRLRPSENVQASSSGNFPTTDTAGSIAQEFMVFHGGMVRLRWEYRAEGSQRAVVNVRLKTHKDVDYCVNETEEPAFVNDSCVLPVDAGSVIQVVLFSPDGNTVRIRNIRLLFNVVETNKPAIALP